MPMNSRRLYLNFTIIHSNIDQYVDGILMKISDGVTVSNEYTKKFLQYRKDFCHYE